MKKRGKEVIETLEPQKLKEFHDLVLSKMCRFWEDAKDIKLSILQTLSHFALREELTGWVRPSGQANTPALADEMARLSRENAELRRQILSRTPDIIIEGLSFEDMMGLLNKKDLLSFLIRLRDDEEFRVNFASDEQEAKELEQLGLVTKSGFGGPVEFTRSGRLFLNRFEAEHLKQTAGSE